MIARPRLLIALAVIAGLLAGAWLWLRDSSLVQVRRVTVTGVQGPDAAQIRGALIAAAGTMTTLDVRMDQLLMAVRPFPVVKNVQVRTEFPHGLRIRVIEQAPVGAVVVGRHSIAVAGDGTLLHDVPVSPNLPVIPVRVPPGGERLTDPEARGAVAVLAAAPYPLLTRLSQVMAVSGHGLQALLRGGPSIYFGDASRMDAKWMAVSEVLADPGSSGASYIDVSDPRRPAAGAQAGGATGAGASAGAPGAGTSHP